MSEAPTAHHEISIDSAVAPREWPGPPLAGSPTVARFALSGSALPRLEAALAVGDCVRGALLRISNGHPVFVGRDPAGQVARGPRHEHAWYLPADDDLDGAIDHVVVYARAGFDPAALCALGQLRHVWGHGGSDLVVRRVDLATPDALGCLRGEGRRGVLAPQLGTARVWESVTPFVPPRHTKLRACGVKDAPDEQVARLLALHGFPPARVASLCAEDVTPSCPQSTRDWQRFLRVRKSGGGSRGANTGFGFRLCFEQPVTGPLALGYAAHQGLGQFVAVAQ